MARVDGKFPYGDRVGSYAALAGNRRQMEATSRSVTLGTDGLWRVFAANARHDGICRYGRLSVLRSECMQLPV